jgi:hypothetical protein
MTMRPFRRFVKPRVEMSALRRRDDLHVLEDLRDPRGIPRRCAKGVPGRIGLMHASARTDATTSDSGSPPPGLSKRIRPAHGIKLARRESSCV